MFASIPMPIRDFSSNSTFKREFGRACRSTLQICSVVIFACLLIAISPGFSQCLLYNARHAMSTFHLKSDYKPAGDQPQAISALLAGLKAGGRDQTLLGVTGSGKTFTMANVIAKWGKPTLVIAHNKTLAAQLASEYRDFFPHNAVHYFVSYYDYYQPEAYMPVTDTFIEKEAQINEDIERLRHAATQALLT